VLSPSGSWFNADLYINEVAVILVTVNLTLVVFVLKPVLDTVHIPLEFVVQVTVPVAPLLQLPVTVALATGFSLLL